MMDVATLEQEALKLDYLSRQRLVESIEKSLHPDNAVEFDDAFIEMIKRRNKELDDDPSIGLSHEEVMNQLRSRLV